jgi:cell division protein FtsI (penicillin-binding protein 3)
VISDSTALAIREMLKEVVENGTAKEANIGAYVLAGKTGTPRGMVDGRYVSGLYNPNFVGLFPADDPQYVIAVRLSNPSGSYYGGKTAAPVTKAVIEAAVVSPRAALDRRRLAASVRREPLATERRLEVASGPAQAGETLPAAPPPIAEAAPVLIKLPAVPGPTPAAAPRVVPDVRGMSLRDAVRTLHSAGFRVGYSGRGGSRISAATLPAAGSVIRQGSLVRLLQ